MGRLIDADLAAEKLMILANEPDYQHEDEDWSVGLYMAESALNEVPTSTIVEQIFADLALFIKDNQTANYSPHGNYLGTCIGLGLFNDRLNELKDKYGVK